MFEILGKSFDTEKEYLDFIVENESLVIDKKKSSIKYADSFGFAPTLIKESFGTTQKAEDVDATEILVKIAINTTNVIDSHSDMHVKGLWKKSLKERGNKILHLQEHKRSFDAVISRGEDLKAYTEDVSWKSLGFDLEGKTEALMFDSLVKEETNAFMFKQYMKGNVTEHSVGMQYMKMVTCINDEDYPVQKENWDKYEPMVANKDSLDGRKVFWAVLEAKAIEGSSVLMGSNSFTPTVTATPKEKLTQKEINEIAVKEWLEIKN